MPTAPIKGLLEAGTVNLYSRPHIQNPDGSHSSLYSMSFDEDGSGHETLIPGVNNERQLTPQEAIAQYHQTGQHLGKFQDVPSADFYGEDLHNRAARGDYDPPFATSRKPIDVDKLVRMLNTVQTQGWTK